MQTEKSPVYLALACIGDGGLMDNHCNITGGHTRFLLMSNTYQEDVVRSKTTRNMLFPTADFIKESSATTGVVPSDYNRDERTQS